MIAIPSPKQPLVLACQAVGVALMYWLAAMAGLAFPTDKSFLVSLLWLPLGIAILACGWSGWMVVGVVAGVLAVELTLGLPWWVAAGIALGSSVMPWLASRWLVRVGVSASGQELEDMRRYLLACGVTALCTSTNGALWLYLGGITHAGNAYLEWGRWLMSDFLGGLLLVAAFWRFAALRTAPDFSVWRRMPLRSVAGWILGLTALVALCLTAVVYSPHLSGPMLLVMAVPAVITALLWGALPAYLTVIVIAGGAVVTTALGKGPFLVDGFQGSDLTLWTYIAGLLLLVMLTLALRQRYEAQGQALQQSEAMFRTLVESASAGVVVSVRGHFTFANEAYARMLGYSVPELIGKHYSEVTDPQDVESNERVRQFLLSPSHVRTAQEFDKRYLRKDGSIVWGRVNLARLEGSENQSDRFIAIVVDLTESRQRQLEWKLKSEQLQLVLDAAHASIWDWRIDSGKTFYSPELSKMLGYESLPDGFSLMEVIHPDDHPVVMEIRKKANRERRPFSVECRLLRGDGQYIWVRAVGSAKYDNNGRVIRYIGSLVDVSAHRQTRLEREARLRAEEASRAKSEFLSRISHELRTPLNAIMGFSQLLELDQQKNLLPRQLEWLGHVRQSGQHLLDLIEDLLNLTRFETGQMQIRLKPVQIQPILDRVQSLLELDADSAQVHLDLKLNLATDLPQVLADELKLTQVFSNLVMNAIKYNRVGGKVTVSSQITERTMLVTVHDTGMGFPQEHAIRMFEPFNRLGMEKTAIEGTGIGLALVKRLVEAMKGSVTASSVLGEGATFAVELQLAMAPSEDRHVEETAVVGPDQPPAMVDKVAQL